MTPLHQQRFNELKHALSTLCPEAGLALAVNLEELTGFGTGKVTGAAFFFFPHHTPSPEEFDLLIVGMFIKLLQECRVYLRDDITHDELVAYLVGCLARAAGF